MKWIIIYCRVLDDNKISEFLSNNTDTKVYVASTFRNTNSNPDRLSKILSQSYRIAFITPSKSMVLFRRDLNKSVTNTLITDQII
jgi:hypothetical protein